MKKHFLFAISGFSLMAASILLSSCDTKQGIVIKFNQDVEQLVEILPRNQMRVDTSIEVVSNLDSILTANDVTRDDIESIVLSSIEVGLTDSLGNDDYTKTFNDFDSVAIRVFVPNDVSIPNVLLSEQKVPSNLWGFGLVLTQQDFDFYPYANQNKFNMRYMSKLNTPITAKKYVKVKMRLEIAGKI